MKVDNKTCMQCQLGTMNLLETIMKIVLYSIKEKLEGIYWTMQISLDSQNVHDELASYPDACLSIMEMNYWIIFFKDIHILNRYH